MFKSIFSVELKTVQILIALGVALGLGIVFSLVNYFTQRNRLAKGNLSQTLVLLPLLVSVIILLVGTNMASALSMAGAFAIIRFRSQAEPKDLSYVLVSMGAGLACGMGYIAYAAIVALIFAIVMVVLYLLKYGDNTDMHRVLKIKVPENMNSPEAFEEVIRQYTTSRRLLKIKTADLGSVYELHYVIKIKKGIKEKAFLDELRIRNGNLTIALLAYSNDFDE